MDLGVVCRTCEELPSRIEDWCSILPTQPHTSIMEITTPSSTAQRNEITNGTCQTTVATTIIATLGAVTGVLLVFSLGTMIALIATCIALRR